jgi:hypothetical protein
MLIRLRDTGAVITDYEFRAANPNTSFPSVLSAELLDGFGADPVLDGPQAVTTNRYQYSMRDGVEQIDGQWFTRYVLGPIFSDYTDAEGVLHTAAEQEAAYRAAKDAEMRCGMSVTPLQIRRALLRAGLLDDVTAFVEAADLETRMAWEYAVQIDRGNALISAAAASIGATDADVDELFRLAAAL